MFPQTWSLATEGISLPAADEPVVSTSPTYPSRPQRERHPISEPSDAGAQGGKTWVSRN